MPNHVLNEITFRGVSAQQQADILALVVNAKGEIDFEVLVPMPLNIWQGSVGSSHEKAFRNNGLDWARDNWGTKWNAYGQSQNEDGKYRSVAQSADTLTLTFQTAWRPPYGWLAAVFNRFQLSFDHNWLDEGWERAMAGKFTFDAANKWEPVSWAETEADDTLHRRMHKLMWGVEEFPPEEVA